MLRIYKPFVFQGSLESNHYFEGWYFKHISENQKFAISFIPGISLNKKDSHSFIQIIDGIKGTSEYIRYSVKDFHFNYDNNFLKVGKSTFSEDGIDINIKDGRISVTGKISYSELVKYPGTIFSPGIMGWYSFVPFMECKHGIVSVDHHLTGILNVNERSINFDNGKGYIEKDWGTSFPEAWIWIQSNNFSTEKTSFSFSVAKIPWLGKFFMGFISFLYCNGRFYLFSTYNGSVISKVKKDGGKFQIILESKHNRLYINAAQNTSGILKAPSMGEMSRKIKESINSSVHLMLEDRSGKKIFDSIGTSAGLEITDKIFELLSNNNSK